ncbi:hypothetical protein [Streptomyces sp. NPDC094466]|uniref:hypothetical protein n=1 Tax=Streptomyces sp. NPDC094466 TaxID=3366065 RepID=UPI0038295E59
MIEEFEQAWASDPMLQPEAEREHTRRMLAAGWPRPMPERSCHTCPHARAIVAYQHVGWLIPRKEEPKPENPPLARAVLERRLRWAETEAEWLRVQRAGHEERRDV